MCMYVCERETHRGRETEREMDGDEGIGRKEIKKWREKPRQSEAHCACLRESGQRSCRDNLAPTPCSLRLAA